MKRETLCLACTSVQLCNCTLQVYGCCTQMSNDLQGHLLCYLFPCRTGCDKV